MKRELLLQGLFWCHRLPERSFHFKGKPFPICARCTGLLVGYLFGLIGWFLSLAFPISWMILFMIPMLLDGGIQYFTPYESHNLKRFVTGVLFGVALIYSFYWTHQFALYCSQVVLSYLT